MEPAQWLIVCDGFGYGMVIVRGKIIIDSPPPYFKKLVGKDYTTLPKRFTCILSDKLQPAEKTGYQIS